MTNREFSISGDKEFLKACQRVGLPHTQHKEIGLVRQAAKWRRKKGLAYKEGREVRS